MSLVLVNRETLDHARDKISTDLDSNCAEGRDGHSNLESSRSLLAVRIETIMTSIKTAIVTDIENKRGKNELSRRRILLPYTYVALKREFD